VQKITEVSFELSLISVLDFSGASVVHTILKGLRSEFAGKSYFCGDLFEVSCESVNLDLFCKKKLKIC
jgi:hypothetical protein